MEKNDPKKTFKVWEDRLLDLSKRNKMLNYRDTKNSSVEIIAPNFNIAFDLITSGNELDIIDTKYKSISEYLKEDVLFEHKNKIKSKNLLMYRKDMDISKSLRYLQKASKNAINEKGINTLFVAYGFLLWHDKADEKRIFESPILLSPVSIKHLSMTSPFQIKEYEDEVILNPTLKYMLKNNYGIEIKEYEDGDALKYLKQIESDCLALGFKINYSIKMSLFSYLKMNMYLDLKNNYEKIIQNKNVRILLKLEDPIAPEINPDFKITPVVNCDSSQLEAIDMAKSGRSFVLQGPPGTGKSQTITNIIAQMLYMNKKVLFVSEKLAALNVVYRNLQKVDLANFCLELHSHKTNKIEVIEELNRTLRLNKMILSSKVEGEMEILASSKAELKKYIELLHMNNPIFDSSLYELYVNFFKYKDAEVTEYIINDIEKKGCKFHNKALELLNKQNEYALSIGRNYHDNAFYGYIGKTSYADIRTLEQKIDAFFPIFEKLLDVAKTADEYFYIKAANINSLYLLVKFYNLLEKIDVVDNFVFQKKELKKAIDIFKTAKENATNVYKMNKILSKQFNEGYKNIDYKKMLLSYENDFIGIKRFFKKEYKECKMVFRTITWNKKPLRYKKALKYLRLIKTYNDENAFLLSKKKYITSIIGDAYNDENTLFEPFIATFTDIYSLDLNLDNFATIKRESFESIFEKIKNDAKIVSDMNLEINDLCTYFISVFDKSIFDISSTDLNFVIKKLEGIKENPNMAGVYEIFNAHLKECEKYDIRKFIDLSISKGLYDDEMISSFEKEYYRNAIYHVISKDEILRNFSRIHQDKLVELFREKDLLQYDIAKAEINSLLSKNRPNTEMIASGSLVSTLIREGEKKRRQMPVRTMLEKMPELIQTLKPCFLMSPLSVSTYIDPYSLDFDVVIFDEASQIFPEDAIGAIYRAKQVIVVGDTNQMPPSDFFTATTNSDDDTYDPDAEDEFESILDICKVYLPQKRLKWHYRSRSEELIAFSNENFYDNELITFPSAKAKERGFGVDFIYVENGIFDRKNKINSQEALMVARTVFLNFDKYPDRSVGVVAFSISQQDEIERAVNDYRYKNPKYEKYFQEDGLEPFFIKNLETVQGDERDTIIFSIAYSKDSDNKFYHNFGPLNRVGGERRLNVAITRAKLNVIVVSSIKSTDINLDKTNSKGSKLLKDYLNYAENKVKEEQQQNGRKVDELIADVIAIIKKEGYKTTFYYGKSNLRIPIAVRLKETGDYLGAIEIDDADYAKVTSASDRERLLPEVLSKFGWQNYRIWSTAWFKDRETEKEKLIGFLKSLGKVEPEDNKNLKPKNEFSIEESQKILSFDTYIQPDFTALRSQFRKDHDFIKLINSIMDIDSPISEDYLIKNIYQIFNQKSITRTVKENYLKLISNISSITRKHGFLYLKDEPIGALRISSTYERELKQVAPEELANGLYEIMKQNIECEKSSAYRILLSYFNISKLTDNNEAILDEALNLIKSDILISGDMLTLTNKNKKIIIRNPYVAETIKKKKVSTEITDEEAEVKIETSSKYSDLMEFYCEKDTLISDFALKLHAKMADKIYDGSIKDKLFLLRKYVDSFHEYVIDMDGKYGQQYLDKYGCEYTFNFFKLFFIELRNEVCNINLIETVTSLVPRKSELEKVISEVISLEKKLGLESDYYLKEINELKDELAQNCRMVVKKINSRL